MATTPDRAATPARLDSNMKLVLSIFLVPAPFEIVTAFAKRESYDYRRLVVVGALLAALTVVVLIWQRRYPRVQSAIGAYLLVVGVVITSLGVVLTFTPDLLPGPLDLRPGLETAVSALTPAAGVLLFAAGVYLLRDQARRTHDDASAPGPSNITDTKPMRLGERNGALWRSPQFGDYPAAEGLVDICKAQLSTADLHYVAFYTPDDRCLFYVDVLGDENMARYNVRNTNDQRRQYEHAGRQARATARRLDRRFRGLESGPIVRLVLDVEKGAIYYYRLRDVGYLLGVTLDQTEVDPTDRKLSAVANEILPYLGGRPDDDFFRK